MTERQWQAAKRPNPLWSFVSDKQQGRKLRLFSCACCRRLGELITDERRHAAISICERFADGLATKKELAAAKSRVHLLHNALTAELHREKKGADITVDPRWLMSVAVHALTSADLEDADASELVSEAMATSKINSRKTEQAVQSHILRDIFGNPFRPVKLSTAWRTDTTVALATQMYESRDFSAMPILADALQDAGCDNEDILDHCRGPGSHVRGCWVVDLVLGKQ
jgi:hypothetical protein